MDQETAFAGTSQPDVSEICPEAADDSERQALSANKSAAPRWKLLTEREQYIATLERRLKAAREPGRLSSATRGIANDGHLEYDASRPPPGASIAGYASLDEDSELDDPPQATLHENTETTSLLFDAHRQQQQWEQDTREDREAGSQANETLSRPADTQERVSHTRKESSQSTSSSGQSQNDASEGPLVSRRNSILAPVATPSQFQTDAPSPAGPADRIHFSDSVRISGGVKSGRGRKGRKSITAGSVFASPDDRERDGASHSVEISPTKYISKRDSPRGSLSRNFDRVTSLSRPASFISDEGRSRASTPASIYAPLLAPSKSAPSPRRHFYLTFQRDDGQATYRELVRRQSQEVRRKRRERRQHRQVSSSHQEWHGRRKRMPGEGFESDDGSADEESDNTDDEDSDSEDESCCNINFWTCGLSRVWKRWRRSWQRQFARDSLNDAETQTRYRDAESESEDPRRPEFKSEMQVLFGRPPWRYFRRQYWVFKWRGLTGDGG